MLSLPQHIPPATFPPASYPSRIISLLHHIPPAWHSSRTMFLPLPTQLLQHPTQPSLHRPLNNIYRLHNICHFHNVYPPARLRWSTASVFSHSSFDLCLLRLMLASSINTAIQLF
ncbi:hypothetical protein P692DRAFT_20873587 [Suillus brevipes Sb2]|nr:hypothetical protein P692DRAFT_20873587 [Suillus brevipes Sb2]